jgi:hypothetical protein
MAGLDRSRISIVSSMKVDKEKLLNVGDSDSLDLKGDAISKRKEILGVKDEKCSLCCMAFGGMMSTGLGLVLSSLKTGYFLFTDRRISNYTASIVVKHILWITIPGICVGSTLHYFLAEAMWSNRRNTWGMAWAKATMMNTCTWGVAIGGGTFFWRKILRYSRWSKYYYRYPPPAERLELRKIENPDIFWSGMGWTYWALGLLTGQLGYACIAGVMVYSNRIHFMMSPVGPYARRCAPRWRREQIARSANYVLAPTQ